jgi:hypothetical protein
LLDLEPAGICGRRYNDYLLPSDPNLFLLLEFPLYNDWHMEGGEQQPNQGQDQGSWQYKPDGAALAAPVEMPVVNVGASQPLDGVEWTASEFVAHEKGATWYLLLALAGGAAAALIYVITRDIISSVAIMALAVILGIAGARKPRVLTYRLDRTGIMVGPRLHRFAEYKSFALIDEGAFWSVVFLPTKRFAVPLSVYLAPEDEQRVIEVLGSYLPIQQGQMGSVDRLMRRMHF